MGDNERSRRRFLRASGLLGAVGLAGCTSVLEETTATPPDVDDASDVEPLVPSETPTATATSPESETAAATATATPEPSVTIGVSEPMDRQRPDLPERPEPDWVVAADGSGDYESLGDAIRVAKSGETIALRAGTYEITSDEQTDDGLQFVGAGRSETSLRVETEVLGPSTHSFHGLTIPEFPELGGRTAGPQVRFYDCSVEPPLVPADDRRGTVTAVRSRFGSRVKTVALEARGCLFEGSVNHRTVRVTDCLFSAGTGSAITPREMERCVFESPADVSLTEGDRVADTVFSGVRVQTRGITDTSALTNCRFRQPDGSTQVARFDGPCDVTHSRFHGSCSPSCQSLFANVFEADGDVDHFIDGTGPTQLYANAFVDGGIRIDSVWGPDRCDKESAAYLEPAGIGNYYSEFDESDGNDDGVLDLPYPIPGGAKLTDRYPLASADLTQYLPLDTDFEACGY